jgi:hypothetical protein
MKPSPCQGIARTRQQTLHAKGGKGNGGRVYEDDDNEGHNETFFEGGGRRWSSSGGEGTQQSNIKLTSTARNLVVITVSAMPNRGYKEDGDDGDDGGDGGDDDANQ